MALFGQGSPQIGGGWGALGDLLGGGLQRVGDAAYADQMQINRREATGKLGWEKALEEAQMTRAARIARDGLPQAVQALGLDPALGQVLLAADGGNVAQYADALGGLQSFAAGRNAKQAAIDGGWNPVNAALVERANGPLTLTAVQGDTYINPLEAPDQQDNAMTPLGDARIAKLGAEARVAGSGGGTATGKPPSGYQWAAGGGLEPIPGGPADPGAKVLPPAQQMKLEQAQRKERLMLDAYDAKTNQTIQLINSLLARSGDFGGVTGMGAFQSYIPGTDSADIRAQLETLRAQSAFGALQEMRANSPTGGALGSVTERELQLLQNAETQLQSYQSPQSLKAALEAYQRILNQSRQRMRGGIDEFYSPLGAAAPPAAQQAGGGVDDILAKYGVQ